MTIKTEDLSPAYQSLARENDRLLSIINARRQDCQAMTNDKRVTMSRELARLLYQDTVSCWGLGGNAANQLSAILAAPVVERQEPVGRVSYIGSGFVRVRTTECLAMEQRLYTSPPAPVAVVIDEQAKFEAWYADDIGLDASEVRSWRKGDDYSNQYERCRSAWAGWKARACLDKVKEMNQ